MARCPEDPGPIVQGPSSQALRHCFDTDALISLCEDGILPELRRWADHAFVAVPEGVLRELREMHRRTHDLVNGWRASVFRVEDDKAAREVLPRLFRDYGNTFVVGRHNYKGLAEGPRAYNAAEFEVIALAKANGWLVVSNETSVHGACTKEVVISYRWEAVRTLLKAGNLPGALRFPGL